MGAPNSKINLDKIRVNVISSYPGLEEQLDIAFEVHDINKAGLISYDVAEPILRHLLIQYGLVDYINRFTNLQGEMDLKYVADFLHYTPELKNQLKPLQNNLEVGVTAEHLKTLAIIWLQKIADVYHADQAQWSKGASMEGHIQGDEMCFNRYEHNPHPKEQYNDNLKLSCHFDVDQNYNQLYNIPYPELHQDYQNMWLHPSLNQYGEHPYQNPGYGLKSFVYPSYNNLGGVCTSAGAVVPMRRPRPNMYPGIRRHKQKPFTRCC